MELRQRWLLEQSEQVSRISNGGKEEGIHELSIVGTEWVTGFGVGVGHYDVW